MDVGPGQGRGRLRFTVLGPVRAWRGDTPLAAGSPQQRALLAALLLRGGRTATAAELVDALWGDEPPHAALAALRTYASRLRKALGEDADVLVSESGGYAIRSADNRPLDLDHDHAEQFAAEAEKAKATGDRGRARELLDTSAGPVGRRTARRPRRPVRRHPAHPPARVAALRSSRPASNSTWRSATTPRRSPS